MSDFFENMNESHGALDAMGNIAAISQRNNLLAAQKKQLEALKEQAQIDKSRAPEKTSNALSQCVDRDCFYGSRRSNAPHHPIKRAKNNLRILGQTE